MNYNKVYSEVDFESRLRVAFVVDYEPDYVIARRMKKSIQETLTTNQRAVLGYLTDHPYASLQETADACELSLGGVKKIVTKLREMTIIERKGAKNNSVWVIH